MSFETITSPVQLRSGQFGSTYSYFDQFSPSWGWISLIMPSIWFEFLTVLFQSNIYEVLSEVSPKLKKIFSVAGECLAGGLDEFHI